MAAPLRLQRKRVAGFRLPDGAVCVTRPGIWSNPFLHHDPAKAVEAYRHLLAGGTRSFEMSQDALRWAPNANPRTLHYAYHDFVREHGPAALAGRGLACFCRLCSAHSQGKPLDVSCPDCAPCHVDVLGPIVNGFRCDPA